jgi:hypothetical protein
MNSPVPVHNHSHSHGSGSNLSIQNHLSLEPNNNSIHTHGHTHGSGSNLNIQNNHLAPPPSNSLQTSHSAHSLHGISPRSPASSERTSHRRTHSTTERPAASSIEQLRGRPALTSSSPSIAPPPSATPFLVPPSSTAHLQGRRRGKSDDVENPFASPFISPAVSPSITPAPMLLVDTNGTAGSVEKGAGERERGDSEGEAHVKAATDPSKAVPDQGNVNHILPLFSPLFLSLRPLHLKSIILTTLTYHCINL